VHCYCNFLDGFDVLIIGLVSHWKESGRFGLAIEIYATAGDGWLGPHGRRHRGDLGLRSNETCFDPRRDPHLVDNSPVPDRAGGLGVSHSNPGDPDY
jgi:hypothetical protein